MATKKRRTHRKGKPYKSKEWPTEPWRPTYDSRGELNQALALQQNGDIQRASDVYHAILNKDPRHPDALHLLGMLMAKKGDYARAIELIRLAIRNLPESEILYNNLGNVLSHGGRNEDAMNAYQKAIEINPGCFDAYNNMGTAAKRKGKPLDAMEYYRKALKIRPASAEAYSDLGNVLAEMGQYDKAIQCYEESLKNDPDFAKAYNNMGISLKAQERYTEAIDFYCKAVEVDPNYAEAFNNIGATITDMGKPDEAVKFFQKALEIKPRSYLFLVNLYDVLKRTNDWNQLYNLNKRLDSLTCKALEHGKRTLEDPFLNLARHDDPALNLAVAKSWSTDISRRMSETKTNFVFDDRKMVVDKITIGYLSSNFRNHALGHLITGLFERHDRSRFNIHAYSIGEDDGSDYRKRIEKSSDKFVDIRRCHHLEAAQSIYNNKVDILIDLMGYTRGGRIEIAALRPAPIQVRYMGMAGTTGSDFFDYLIADQIVVPKQDASYYSEKLVYLPDCYQVNDYQQIVSNHMNSRKMFGLPEDAFVLCSFNQAIKLDPVMYDAWMKILKGVPGSVLWMLAGSNVCEKHLISEAEDHGIAKERIVFGGKMDKAEHLARLQLADLALDTRLVNGAATTSDALWAGVPVITLKGKHYSSRMSASILMAIGMGRLVTDSLDDYINLAVRFGKNTSKINCLRKHLHKNQKLKPLFNTNLFIANLERCYEKIWNNYISGLLPKQIDIYGEKNENPA